MNPLRQFFFPLFCLLALALTTQAQTEDQVRDLQKLYKTAEAPGLQVTVYLQQKDGSLMPVEPQQEFHQGERVKIRIESNFRGYLYVINHGASGKKLIVFPDQKESNLIQPGASYLLPSTYELVFDENAGFETLQIIVAPQRLAILDTALKQPEGKLKASQIAAVANFWNDPMPDQAGITAGSADSSSIQDKQGERDINFDKKGKTTTVVNRPQKGSAKQKTSPQSAPPPTSVGIRLRNTGKQR